MESMCVTRPTKRAIGKIAENQPGLLNLLVAYFVFEWRSVRIGNPSHGIDQTGKTCVVPNYVSMWDDPWTSGVDTAVHLLLNSPESRKPVGPGYVSSWLDEITL